MAKQVLVPIDGSDRSKYALRFALDTHPDAAVTVLYVVDPAEAVIAAEEGGPLVAEGWYQRAENRAEDILADAQTIPDGTGATVETATDVGQPARVIVEYANDHDVDHIVIGSRGRTGASRLLLGSVAESVVRRASVPVTVVHDRS